MSNWFFYNGGRYVQIFYLNEIAIQLLKKSPEKESPASKMLARLYESTDVYVYI